MGDQAYWSAHGGWVLSETWTGFNYACPEVCQSRLADIECLCKNSDCDGIDLDFFRVPLYFKIGEGHKQENRDIMTQLVHDIRQLIDGYGRARGRPYLLSPRFPKTPAQALSIGLDVEAWLQWVWLNRRNRGRHTTWLVGRGVGPGCVYLGLRVHRACHITTHRRPPAAAAVECPAALTALEPARVLASCEETE